MQEFSDAELDALILTRLRLCGVDISVLPEDDPSAPADQRRILNSARGFLRGTPGAIIAYEMDPQDLPPVLYPAEMTGWTREGV
jgi:hypothetical protein